jgi:hypothetical protein
MVFLSQNHSYNIIASRIQFKLALPKWTDIWWEAPMEGSVLSFLKAEWKVSDSAEPLV